MPKTDADAPAGADRGATRTHADAPDAAATGTAAVHLVVDPAVEQIPRARRFVVDAVAELGGPSGRSFLDDLALIASEAITNAVEHAGTPVQVTVEPCRGGVRVTVHDASTAPIPSARDRRAPDVGGRGLTIIDALADRWGVDRRPGEGKALWFELRGSD